MDRGAWQATVHGVTQSLTRLKQLSMAQAACHVINPLCLSLTVLGDGAGWEKDSLNRGARPNFEKHLNMIIMKVKYKTLQ